MMRMTREEAIQVLKSIKTFYRDIPIGEDFRTAVDLAIESLSAEPNKMSVNVEYDVEYLSDKDGVHQAKATITKAEPMCETCRHNDEEWYSTACDSCCGSNSHYEPSDLVSRQDVIDRLNELHREVGEVCSDDYDRGTLHGLAWAIDILKGLPSADRPSGEFKICGNSNGLNGTMYYVCSLCGTPIDPCDKFCRGCGARMKGVTE